MKRLLTRTALIELFCVAVIIVGALFLATSL